MCINSIFFMVGMKIVEGFLKKTRDIFSINLILWDGNINLML